MTAFVLLSLTAPRPTQPISKSALSHSVFVLQSSVCLYGLAFALSHSLFVLQSFVYLYGFAFALSPSLFVGAWVSAPPVASKLLIFSAFLICQASKINCGYVLHYNSINLFSIIAVMFREGQAPPLQNFITQKSAICNKQRILYIQFSSLVKMVSGSKAIMF